MMAEGVPLDPRVLVEAHDPKYSDRTYLKSRLACTHPPDVASIAGLRGSFFPGWVVGDDWQEKYPHFPHSEMHSKEDMEKFDALYKSVSDWGRRERTMARITGWEKRPEQYKYPWGSLP
jgi:hypothetical protein